MVHDTLILGGELGLWVTLLMAGWGAVVSFVGAAMDRGDLQTSGRRASYVAAASALVAVCGLVNALVAHDFALEYVAQYSNASLSTALAVSAVWAGPAGALLVGICLTAIMAAWTVAGENDPRDRATAHLTGGVSALVFIATLVLVAVGRPYSRLAWLAADGAGLDPMLRHVAPAAGGLILLCAYAAGAMAVAFAATAHTSGQAARMWRPRVHRWTLAAWTGASLGIGLLLRGAYLHSGVAGLWWPAEGMKAAGVFWLAASAALHITGRREPKRPGRVGETVAHAGVAIAAVALVAGAFAGSQSAVLRTGQAVPARDMFGRAWTLIGQGVSQYSAADHAVTAVSLNAAPGAAAGAGIGPLLVARQLSYGNADDTVATSIEVEPAIVHTALGDLRVVVESVADDAARVRVSVVPFAWAFWFGALLTVIGGAAALVFDATASNAEAA